MYEPTEEEKQIIEKMERRRAERKAHPPEPHPRPERFDFPIGLDDEGRPFPVHDRNPEDGDE